MRQSTLSLLFLLFLISSCKDDDNGSDGPNEPSTEQATSGEVSGEINGSDFTTTNNVARYRSNGGFLIRSSNDQGRELKFVLANFIGNGTYAITPGQNTSRFIEVVNNQTINYSGLSGSLTISNYNDQAKTFDAEFDVVFTTSSGSAVSMNAQGTYEGLKIFTIPVPEEGQVVIFANDKEYLSNSATISAGVNNLDVLVSEIEFDGMTIELYTYLYEIADPSSIGLKQFSSWILLSGGEIVQWNYDEVNLTISGQLKSLQQDLEIKFSNVAVAPLPTYAIEVGEALYVNGSDTLRFDNCTYRVIPGEIFYYIFEATNDQNRKLYFEVEEEYDFNAPFVYTGPGRNADLEYYSNASNSSPSFTASGRYTVFDVEGEPNKVNVYFESNNQQVFFRSNTVDKIQ